MPIPDNYGQVLVRGHLRNCNTDIEVTRGYFATRIMGHEFVGV